MFQDTIKTISIKGKKINIHERETYESEYNSKIILDIDLCTNQSLIPDINTLITNEIMPFAKKQHLYQDPYLYSHQELTLNFHKSQCHKKDLLPFEQVNLEELGKINKHLQINTNLSHTKLNSKFINKFDTMEINGITITSMPFNDKIQIARLNLEGRFIDLDFVKNISFTPTNDKAREDHYYNNGIHVSSHSEFRFNGSNCKAVLPNDLSNAESLLIECKTIDTSKLKGKIKTTNLKKLNLGIDYPTTTKEQVDTILGNLDDLSTIEFLEFPTNVDISDYAKKLTSVRRMNNEQLSFFHNDYANLRGFNLNQMKKIIRNTAPVSFGEDKYPNIEGLAETCWECVSPYDSCDKNDYSSPIKKEKVEESDQACEMLYNTINEEDGEIVLKVYNKQPLTKLEQRILPRIKLNKYSDLFEKFDFTTIQNPEIRSILETQTKNSEIKMKSNLNILL